ncbi:hypothetical protein ABZP36_002606 [Zizania latifolia]
MSQRGDRVEGHARRPSRSSSFGGHRGGGVGGAGKGGGAPSGQPPLSSNRSFRKPGNGHGVHPRVVSQPDTTGFQPAPAPTPLQTPPRPPAPQNVPGHVPVPTPRPQHHDSSGVRAPVLTPAIENTAVPVPKSIPHAAPKAPSRISNTSVSQGATKGEPSVILQFGTIGIPHFPARTSSAPPNLDEQKRMQALPEGHKVAPSVLVPPALKQQPLQQKQQPHPQPQQPPPQQTRKDAVSSSQPNPVNPHLPSQVKRDVRVSPSVSSVPPPRHVQQLPGVAMPMPYRHQAPVQFGGHNSQMPPQSVVPSSLQMPMMHGGNAPQVPQNMYVSTIPHHQLQQTTMMHGAQGIPYVPSATHQLTTQMGNIMNVGVGPQYQQPPNKFVAPRKTPVKITHPDTHEELKLDKRIDSSGQRGLHNIQQQSQPVSSYGTHMGFYPSIQPNAYNQSAMFYPNAAGISQVPTVSQGPRFTYPVSQAGQAIPFISPSMSTVPGSNKDSIPGPTASSGHSQVTGKVHPAGLHMEKSGAHTVTITAPPSKSDAPRLRLIEDAVSHRQKDSQAVSVVAKSGSDNERKAPLITEKHPMSVSQPLKAQGANTETTAPASSVINEYGADGKSKESIQRTESFKDSNKNVSRKDTGNLSQQQQSASSAEDLKVQTSLKVVCDGVSVMEAENVNKELELTNSASSSQSESRISPGVTTYEADSKSLKAVDVSSTDRRSASESTDNPQVGTFDVAAVESEQTEITCKILPDLTKDEFSSGSIGNVSHEVCSLDLAEQSPVRASNPDNSDATTCVTDLGQLLKESAPSVSDEHVMMDISHLNTENLPESGDGTVPSVASSETSSESSIENANTSNQETGSAISSTIPDVLSATHPELSEDPQKLETMIKDQSGAATTASFRPASREKPSVEITRTKSTAGKKKKRKEMLSKADAAGSSDLYNAYKGPEEKIESIGTIESPVSSSIVGPELLDESEREVNMGEDEEKKKVEPDDWEEAADISTPKLESSYSRNQASVAQESDLDPTEANGRKRYSRDFLLTLAPNCTNLPVGFQMVEFASVLFPNLAGKSYVVDHPSPGRGIDRPTSRGDRRGAALEDDRWGKSGHPFGSGRDMPLDNGPPAINHRGAPGGNHGVLRNPRGGLLGGPITPQIARMGSDADRWQQKGLFPSPVTPMQVMHKAEKKYVVGKVSDEEENKQRQLKAILNKLTPQNFEKLFEKVKEVNIDNVATLTGVISQIFDKALMEPTFCEMYANFCFHLAGALPDFSEDNEKITFKRLLLNKCQEEFERGEREEAEADKTEEEGEIKQTKEEREEKRIRARRRMLGNIRLIGELYKKRMLTERIMHECIKKLLGDYQNSPDEENIEALCKLMSTIGEMIDHAKAKEHMDAYFDIMQKLSTSQQLSSRVRFMLRDSIDLRRNKWQQRRKVEGPKKIEEVHRDAAQERHAQSSRLARGSVVGSAPRRGAAPMDYGPRGSAAALAPLSSQQGGHRGTPSHSRGIGNQDIRFDNRTVPLPQRKDEALTLGPQGGLARGMSKGGQPPISNAELSSAVDNRRMVSGSNGYNPVVSTAREEPSSRIPDRSGRTAPITQLAGPSHRPASQEGSGNKSYSEEDLREKSISAIREYYSAKDEDEVALCIEELNAPSFYPSVVSLWINDSFERKDMERELLTKLFVSLCNGRNNLLSKPQLIEGLVIVLASLEDALSDAPRAAEYLGRLLARFVVESILSLQEVGTLVEKGGEEPGDLVLHGVGADVLGVLLESIREEKGDSFLNEAKTSSKLKLEDFRPQHLKRSKLDSFISA